MMKANVLLAVALLATSGSGLARGPHGKEHRARDHDYARQAMQRGEVLPLARILPLAAAQQPGDIVEIELRARGPRLFYEVEVLVPSGEVRELLIDARNGKLLRNSLRGD